MIVPIGSMKRWWRSEESAPPPQGGRDSEKTFVSGDEPWLKELDRVGIPRTLTYPTTTLGRLLDQTADRFPDAPALFYNHQSWTYGELLAAVNRAAGGLAGLGVRRGDRVLLALPNCPEFFLTFLGAQKLGAVVVNAGPLMGLDDLRAVIEMTVPRLTIGLDLQSPLLTRAGEGRVIEHWVWVSLQAYQPVLKRLGYQYKLWHRGNSNGHGAHHISFAELLENAPARPPTVAPDPSHVAVLQPTGGTTGTLKLTELSHRNLLCNAAQVATLMNARDGQERVLSVLPLFHVYGLMLNLVAAIYSASYVILTTRFHCEETLELIRQHHPTIFPLVPAICEAVSDALEADGVESPAEIFRGLRLCISGSAPLPVAVAERFERLTGARVVEGYGLSEASPVTHVNPPADPRAGSIGLPIPDTRVRVVDLDDPARPVRAGEPGELLLCGPQIMRGYFGNPLQTAKALTTDENGDRWLHTGDVVRYDEDGYFYLLDRRKDMIIRSGLKVYPAHVERVLKMHEGVADAAVVGRPDPVHTQVVTAIVVPKDGWARDDRPSMSDALRALCREHLAPYEVPESFEFADALPRSALGKLLRNQVRASLNGASPVVGKEAE